MRAGLLAFCLLFLASGSWAQDLTQTSPQPSAEAPSVPWSLSKASAELLTRLTERRQQVQDLQANLQTLTDALTASQTDSDALKTALESSQSELVSLQADLTATSTSLAESRQDLADLETAYQDERKAREAELLRWQLGAGGAVIVAVVGVVWGVTHH